MAQTVDTSGLDRLVESWDRLLKQFPDGKRKALEQMWRYLLLDVQRKIGGSGKVAGWQAPHMGTKGGLCGRPGQGRHLPDHKERKAVCGGVRHERH